MNADELASSVAHHMLSSEGTGPAWGVRLAARTLGFHPNSRSSTLLHPTKLIVDG